MREFRLLNADEIECRISEVRDQYIKLLLYKTARTDAALLDEKFGIFGWQNKYEVINGKMYCGIGVFNAPMDDWVWKWNVGTESNVEKEKGEASDAMKRAGFVWGIGTELYSAPSITLWLSDGHFKLNNGKCYDRFAVSVIEYDARQDISRLVIVNEGTGAVAYNWSSGKPSAPVATPQAAISPEDAKAFEQVMVQVEEIIESVYDIETANAAAVAIPKLEHVQDSKRRASKMLRAKADSLGLVWNKDAGRYVENG